MGQILGDVEGGLNMSFAGALIQQYPGIVIGEIGQAECSYTLNPDGSFKITYWSRPEPQPDEAAVMAAFDAVAWDAGVLARQHPALVAALTDSTNFQAKLVIDVGLAALDEINILRRLVIGVGTVVWDPASMTNATGLTSANITVAGAAFGDFVEVAAPYSLAGITANAYVSAANTVNIRLHNGTGAAVNLASGTWNVAVRRDVLMPDRTKPQLRTVMTNHINAGDADS